MMKNKSVSVVKCPPHLRKVRDSNPRYPKGYTGFRVQRDRSLCQPSRLMRAKVMLLSDNTKLFLCFYSKESLLSLTFNCPANDFLIDNEIIHVLS